MKLFKMNSITKTTGRVAMISGLAVMLGTGSAVACSLQNWSSASTGMFASQPDGAGGDPSGATSSARYAGLCGATAPAGEFVQDDRPGGIERIIARFYVLNDGANDPVVYRGNTSGSVELFNVQLVGGNAVLNAGGTTVQGATQPGWNSIEIDWDSAGGSIGIIVNGGTEDTATGISTASLANVQVGNLNAAAGGSVVLDGYEAHLSTPVGRICNCNANGSADDVVNVQDIFAVLGEAGGGALASGTPDCNEDGNVNVQDIFQTLNIAGSSGVCVL
jgi:hypothetical protein